MIIVKWFLRTHKIIWRYFCWNNERDRCFSKIDWFSKWKFKIQNADEQVFSAKQMVRHACKIAKLFKNLTCLFLKCSTRVNGLGGMRIWVTLSNCSAILCTLGSRLSSDFLNILCFNLFQTRTNHYIIRSSKL